MTRNSWVDSGSAPSTPPSTAGDRGVVVIHSIQKKVIVALARTIHREPPSRLLVCDVPGDKQNQFIRIARDQRQVFDGSLVHQIADLRGFEIDVGNLVGAHLNFFGDRARFQLHIH